VGRPGIQAHIARAGHPANGLPAYPAAACGRAQGSRHQICRIVRRIGRRAGVSVHPHQLRQTLATQAINRGMRLEAIAALLGHRSMEMTLIYARIANWVVADECRA
jgi:site-specific recombinase XerD